MDDHTYIGNSADGSDLWLPASIRARHIGIFGSTGVGKSTLLLNLIAQDIARGDGLLLLDPHGDLAESALRLVPPHRHNQVCYFNVADLEYPVAFNVVEDVAPDQRARVTDGVVSAMRGIWRDSWGARLEQILRHSVAALLEMSGASLVLLPRLLTDDAFRARALERVSNPLTRNFFGTRFNAWRDAYREEAIDPVLNKVDAFLFSEATRHILGQARSTLHFERAIARRRIVIANLAEGLIGETNAFLMGALLLARVRAAATQRVEVPEQERHAFHILIDEAQAFRDTPVLSQLFTGARKFGITLTLATQHLAALDPVTRASLLGNVATLIAFQVGHEDAEVLAPQFDRLHQQVNPHALRDLERGHAMVRSTATDGSHIELPPPPAPRGDPAVVKRQSRLHYGVNRRIVEANMRKILQVPD